MLSPGAPRVSVQRTPWSPIRRAWPRTPTCGCRAAAAVSAERLRHNLSRTHPSGSQIKSRRHPMSAQAPAVAIVTLSHCRSHVTAHTLHLGSERCPAPCRGKKICAATLRVAWRAGMCTEGASRGGRRGAS